MSNVHTGIGTNTAPSNQHEVGNLIPSRQFMRCKSLLEILLQQCWRPARMSHSVDIEMSNEYMYCWTEVCVDWMRNGLQIYAGSLELPFWHHLLYDIGRSHWKLHKSYCSSSRIRPRWKVDYKIHLIAMTERPWLTNQRYILECYFRYLPLILSKNMKEISISRKRRESQSLFKTSEEFVFDPEGYM